MDLITYALAKKYTDQSLLGTSGALVGKSAFQIAQDAGFQGTEQQWLDSLTGYSGETPEFRIINSTEIQYRFATEQPTVWTTLLDVADLIDNKLDKVISDGGRHVYTSEPDGTQGTEVIVSNSPAPNSMVMRNDDGTFAVGDPTQDNQPAHKKYVDDKIIETSQQIIYINDIQGVVTNGTSQAFINSLLDKGFERGYRLVGMVRFTDFPINMNNAELTLDVFSMNPSSVLYIAQLASTDTSPYIWFAVEQGVQSMRWRPLGGTTNHAQLTNLAASDSGHTGFVFSSERNQPNGVIGLDAQSNAAVSGNFYIEGTTTVQTPTQPSHAATKAYVDSQSGGGTGGADVEKVFSWEDGGISLSIVYQKDPTGLQEIAPRLAEIMVGLIGQTSDGAFIIPDGDPENLSLMTDIFISAGVTGLDMRVVFGETGIHIKFGEIVAYDADELDGNRISGMYSRPDGGMDYGNPDGNVMRVRFYTDGTDVFANCKYLDVGLKTWNKTVISGNAEFTAEVQHTGDTGALDVLTDDILTSLVFVAAVLQETIIGSQTNMPLEDFQTLVKGLYDAKVVRINLSGSDGVSTLAANMENWQVLYDDTNLGYNEMFAVMTMPMAGRNLQSNKFELRFYYDEEREEVLTDAVFGGGYFMQKIHSNTTINLNPGETTELFSAISWGDYYGISGIAFDIETQGNAVIFPEIASYTPYTIETRITANVQGTEADYTIALVRPNGEQLAKDTESVKLGTSGGFTNNSNTLHTYTDGVNDPYSTDGVRLLLTNYELGEPLEITGIEIRVQGVRS